MMEATVRTDDSHEEGPAISGAGRKLVITCGGTGGHFYPGLSVARRHRENGGDVLLLLSGVNAAAQRATAESFGIPAIELPTMPSPGRLHPLRWWRFGRGLLRGMLQARRELRRFAPDAVLGMGSFASVPVLAAAYWGRIPIFLHDGNARIGRANRWLSRVACFLGTAFPAVNADQCRCPVDCTGMPLRPELLRAESGDKFAAIERLNTRFGSHFRGDLPTLLIFGGSQGAATLNRNFPAALRQLGVADVQVIHLAGPAKLEEVRNAYTGVPFRVLALDACEEMAMLYTAADLVIARSGGSTTAEIALFGKPAVLIPYPYAAEGHQWDNARCLVAAGAAEAVNNADCTVGCAASLIGAFLDNPDEWREKGRRALTLARPRATDVLLERIFQR